MASNAQESAEATGKLIEEAYYKDKKDIYEIIADMSLGDVRFENSFNPNKKPLPLEYHSAKVMVTYGGPTTWVHSTGEIVSYWGSEDGHWYLDMNIAKELDEYFSSLFDFQVEQVVKSNSYNW